MSDSDGPRVRAAALLRELGHEFVARAMDEATLETLARQIESLLDVIRTAPPRERGFGSDTFETFRSRVPEHGHGPPRYLFADSIVSGGANPMGLGAYLWRDGDQAVMEVTLGRAFEGAPDRAHGGIVAALIDETMGLVLSIHGLLAFTVQLDISYRAPTPVNAPLVARAWLESRDGRKLSMRATVVAGETTVVEATSLFIAVDTERFRIPE